MTTKRILTRDKTYYLSLITLAAPVALQNLISFLVSFADNLMVGTLGDSAVSGVYMGSQIQVLLTMFTGGIASTIVILGAQYWGKRDTASIRRIVATGLRYALAVGAVFSLVCFLIPEPIVRIFTQETAVITDGSVYLKYVALSFLFFCITQALVGAMRCVETTFVGMAVSLVSLVFNVGGNYVLIFGKLGFDPMGIKGAAIATLLSRIMEMLMVLIYVLTEKKLRFRLKELFIPDRAIGRDFIKYGTPLILGEVVWSVNMLVNSMIMGRYGSQVITAVSVANTMNTLAYVTISGLASAVGIITGKTVGAGQTDKMKEYARTTQVLFLTVGFAVGGFVALLNPLFVDLYKGITPEAAQQSRLLIRVLSVTIVGTCYQMPCLFGLVKSGGDISFVFKNDSIFVFGVVLPSAIIAAWLGAPAWVTFACLKCDQILKCAVAVVKVNKYNWMKNLTRAET